VGLSRGSLRSIESESAFTRTPAEPWQYYSIAGRACSFRFRFWIEPFAVHSYLTYQVQAAGLTRTAVHRDLGLAQRIYRGERRAFEEFVDTFGARVHRLVRRYVDNPTDGEDVTQEIFCDLHRSIGAYRGEAALSTWVYRVALNHCWKYRQKSRPESVPFDEQFIEAADDDWRMDPAASVAKGELAEQVHAALGELSASHHDVVVLCEMQGLTYQECANALQIPIGTVKSRLFHAFRRLRGLLGGYVQEGVGLVPNTAGDGD